MERVVWENLGEQEHASWYLHPLVGKQKREVHLQLVRRWTRGLAVRSLLKTDLFEEAFGEDQFLSDLFPEARLTCGMDEASSTVRRAAVRYPSIAPGVAVMDVRKLAWRKGSFDLVISTSTLDHFSNREDYVRSLHELSELLRPGGILVLTLDNPLNPLYHVLRWFSRSQHAPFPLGYTTTIGVLRRDLEKTGLRINSEDWLIHNPRGVSTALFIGLSKLFGRGAHPMIAGLLSGFALFGKLPTRRFTACFQAVLAVKPSGSGD